MMELESMAVAMPEVAGHPNRAAFRGVLTLVDVPSQRAPSGAKGRKVVLTRQAAEAALPSLLGMALDYAPEFDRHDVRRKVGVITSADVVERNLEVGGYLYAKDFPDIVEEVARSGRRPAKFVPRHHEQLAMEGVSGMGMGDGTRLRASLALTVERLRGLMAGMRGGGSGGLGMSFEVTQVKLVDERSRIWMLKEVTFTGAAILRRSKAAFQDTWIELVS